MARKNKSALHKCADQQKIYNCYKYGCPEQVYMLH